MDAKSDDLVYFFTSLSCVRQDVAENSATDRFLRHQSRQKARQSLCPHLQNDWSRASRCGHWLERANYALCVFGGDEML
ncbi:hypothetical protein TNCT_294091 [Trichonephila clavata]|uniref:Uncharacterized protein n=1 Tax=Trichonephila clavata TaxID=2740835 RepID=A0A8X6HPI7_TRICU|nr:hypothetical protein TNCT_294091 [Trichonephila clavata]